MVRLVDTEASSLDALRAVQLERLRQAVSHAYDRVPHYRRKFDAAGIHPTDLRSLDDLSRFPFTTKNDLRENYPFGLFAVPREEVVRVHVSSGTTGKPTVVGYTRADIDTWSGLMARSLKAAGVGPGDIVHNAFGYGLFTGGIGFHYGAERVGALVVPAGGGFTERQVQLIADFRPTVLCATPSYALVIADTFEKLGLDPAAAGLRIALCGAEPWSEGMRREIETRFGVRAYDTYGLSEVIGPGVAAERPDDGKCLTIWEDCFYPEVIDPETGRAVPDGEPGELVLTTLAKEAMPVVRYRTRDLTRLLPSSGGAFRRMDRVKGRSDDMLIIRGVNVFPSQIEAILSAEPRLAPQYVLELRRSGRLDELTVRVEHRPGALDGGDTTLASLRDIAEHLIKVHAGVTTVVDVVPPGTVERSQGKAKRVIDLRPKEEFSP